MKLKIKENYMGITHDKVINKLELSKLKDKEIKETFVKELNANLVKIPA